MSIGSNIKKRRFELGMSQQDLADALGYKTRSTIAKIESGENEITQKKLVKFAEVLDTSVEELMGFYRFNLISNFQIDFNKRHKTVAVILAGGKSVRNYQNIPNQFINILGKPVIIYSMEAYQKHPAIDDIYIVCLKGWEEIVTAYAEQYRITKLKGVVPGENSGILSVKAGLEYVKGNYDENDVIVFQESTRPMVTVEMISKLLQSCYENGSSNICQSTKDHLHFTYVNNEAMCVDRNTLVELQSPEAYQFTIINSIFKKADELNHPLTESCCALLMHNLGFPINFIEGNNHNIKILRQEDVAIFTALLKMNDLI